MSIFGFSKSSMITPDKALPGHAVRPYEVGETHAVLGTSMTGPWSPTAETIFLAMGCFWGAEEIFWRIPGVVTTSVGYMGGYSLNPTYEEVCTGLTGHTETTCVVYEPAELSTYDVLKTFWENHDPTQGYRQGGDMGTQYRSAIFTTNDEQRSLAERTRDSYQPVITDRGYDAITTQILSAKDFVYYLAEEHHQQYLYKVPNGYRCHAKTGLSLPALAT
jgi:peptide-methionine (S)-S-oxide reductase